MNYRHAFHAGNHADVLKHAVLCFALARLAAKDKPFAVIETHAGRGAYDLTGDAAQRTGEAAQGVAKVLEASDPPEALAPYLAAVRRFGAARYPGSPLLALDALRAGDRYRGCELHPEEFAALRAACGRDPRARLLQIDGYTGLRSLLPPPERRGLVLIDPPFEAADEFATLAPALIEAVRRWPSGGFLVWMPEKDARAVAAFEDELVSAAIPDMVAARLRVRADAEKGLAASRVLLVRPPHPFEAAFADALPWLARTLAQGEGAEAGLRRLTPE